MKAMQENEVEKYLHDLWRSLVHAGMSYRVWRVLKEGMMAAKESEVPAQEWVGVINSYSGFFEPTMQACMKNSVVALHNFFHAIEDTVNLPKISEELRKHEYISDDTLDKVRTGLNQASELRSKIARLRNKSIAHRDKNQIGKDLFAEIGLSGDDIQRLITTGHELLNLVSSESIRNSYSGKLDFVEEHTKALMGTLLAK